MSRLPNAARDAAALVSLASSDLESPYVALGEVVEGASVSDDLGSPGQLAESWLVARAESKLRSAAWRMGANAVINAGRHRTTRAYGADITVGVTIRGLAVVAELEDDHLD
jgi:hypothetical protein